MLTNFLLPKPQITEIRKIIDEGNLDDFLALAKSYNIFQDTNTGKLYKETCDKIKQRLDREGLSHDIVRPE